MAAFFALFSVAVIFFITIYIHEKGHYIAAKYLHIPISEFSIGIGPRIFKWIDKYGTLHTIRLLPIAGYISPNPRFKIANGANAVMTAAGPLANIIVVVFIYLVIRLLDTSEHNLTTNLHSILSNIHGYIGGILLDPFSPEYWVSLGEAKTGTSIKEVMGNLPEERALGLLLIFFCANLLMAGFNLLPLGPLDGGRLINLAITSAFPSKIAAVISKVLFFIGLAIVIILFASDVLMTFMRIIF